MPFRPTPIHLLVFAVSFAMVGICTALALDSGANPLTVVTIRTLGTVALMTAVFVLTKVNLSMNPRDRLIAIAIGIPLCINNFLINSAIAELPVPLVVLIFYLWPAITSAASWLLRKEPFRWRGLAGLALAFAGVALALNVDFSAAQAKGVWLAAGAAVNWSIVFMLTSHFVHGRDTLAPTLTMNLTAAAVCGRVHRHRRREAAGHDAGLDRRDRHRALLRVRDDRDLHGDGAHRADAHRVLHELRADRGGAARGADPRPDPGADPARRGRAGDRRAFSVPAAR